MILALKVIMQNFEEFVDVILLQSCNVNRPGLDNAKVKACENPS
jgi:hypothetical protein